MKKDLNRGILKQAIRDLASKDPITSDSAITFFKSKEYQDLCDKIGINKSLVDGSVKELIQYPLVSRKKLANQMAKMLDMIWCG